MSLEGINQNLESFLIKVSVSVKWKLYMFLETIDQNLESRWFSENFLRLFKMNIVNSRNEYSLLHLQSYIQGDLPTVGYKSTGFRKCKY